MLGASNAPAVAFIHRTITVSPLTRKALTHRVQHSMPSERLQHMSPSLTPGTVMVDCPVVLAPTDGGLISKLMTRLVNVSFAEGFRSP